VVGGEVVVFGMVMVGRMVVVVGLVELVVSSDDKILEDFFS